MLAVCNIRENIIHQRLTPNWTYSDEGTVSEMRCVLTLKSLLLPVTCYCMGRNAVVPSPCPRYAFVQAPFSGMGFGTDLERTWNGLEAKEKRTWNGITTESQRTHDGTASEGLPEHFSRLYIVFQAYRKPEIMLVVMLLRLAATCTIFSILCVIALLSLL